MNKFRKPHGSAGTREHKDAKSGGFGGPRKSFGGAQKSYGRPMGGARSDSRSGSREGNDRELFSAKCDNCGKLCQVPFRPNGQKPVYCRDCFGSPHNEKISASRNNSSMSYGKPSFGGKPSFTTAAPSADHRIEDMKKQLDAMNAKLDSIFQVIVTPHQLSEDTKFPAMPTPKKEREPAPKKKPFRSPARNKES